MKRIVLLSVALLATVFGGVLLKYGTTGLLAEYSARSWHTTEGVVKGNSIEISDGRRQRLWCPRWKYHYVVAGQAYVGTRTAVGTTSCEKSFRLAEVKLDSRPVNALVQVIYDPSNPGYSALYVSNDRGFFRWFLVASGVAFVVMGGLVISRRDKAELFR